MGMIRRFHPQCNKCGGNNYALSFEQATMVREFCHKDLWTISGNKFTCPVCNKRDLDYWSKPNESR